MNHKLAKWCRRQDMKVIKKSYRINGNKERTSALFAIIATVVATSTAIATYCLMRDISNSADEIAEAQNQITETQAATEKVAHAPEFVYLGPEIKTCTCDESIAQPEGHYDYG